MATEERVARAISGAPFPSERSLKKATAAIEAHIAALADAGMVIAPIEPYDTMVSRGTFTGDRELTRAIYKAMMSYILPEGPDDQ